MYISDTDLWISLNQRESKPMNWPTLATLLSFTIRWSMRFFQVRFLRPSKSTRLLSRGLDLNLTGYNRQTPKLSAAGFGAD